MDRIMDKKCTLCKGELLEVVCDKTISYKIISEDKYACMYTDKYVCSKCGYIQEYARIFEEINDGALYEEEEQVGNLKDLQ